MIRDWHQYEDGTYLLDAEYNFEDALAWPIKENTLGAKLVDAVIDDAQDFMKSWRGLDVVTVDFMNRPVDVVMKDEKPWFSLTVHVYVAEVTSGRR